MIDSNNQPSRLAQNTQRTLDHQQALGAQIYMQGLANQRAERKAAEAARATADAAEADHLAREERMLAEVDQVTMANWPSMQPVSKSASRLHERLSSTMAQPFMDELLAALRERRKG